MWRVSGTGALGPHLHQFETLCGLGGRFLEKVLTDDSDFTRALLAEQDPKVRWYRLLKHKRNGVREEFIGWQTDNAGNNMGSIFTGSIDNLVEVCANQCLELQVHLPIPEEKKRWNVRLYEDYGKELIRGAIALLIAAMLTAALASVFG
jgi:hypothetical protein